MQTAEASPSSSAPAGSVGDLLGEHHRDIEAACLEIMSAALADDPRDLVLRWRAVERRLLDHMAAEEQVLLPAYQQAEPENAQDLRDEHAVLRDHAYEIGISIQLHAISCARLQQFVDELRAHTRREQASLYRWTEQHGGAAELQRLVASAE